MKKIGLKMLKIQEKQQMTVAILNSKLRAMVSAFIFGVLIFISDGVVAQDVREIQGLIRKELCLIDEYYEDKIFINNSKQIDTTSIRINSCKKLQKYSNPQKFYSYDIVLVNVSLANLNTIQPKRVNLDSMNFEYLLIEKNGTYYKLCGFLTTDINYLKVELYEKEMFDSFIEWVSHTLLHNKLLTKVESKKLKQSLINNDHYYSRKINRPINILNKLYPNRLYQTTIIDYEWIKPIIVN